MANIKVAVRVRPVSEREINLTGSEIVVHTEPKVISLTNLKVSSSKAGDSRERTRRYGFNYCFDSSEPDSENYASQAKIYETLGESILEALFKGYNSCLVAYGQSASGKTYTMMGSKEDPGLTPRVCEGLFLRLADEEKTDKNYDVAVSYLEVYNERVRDLLRPTSNSNGLRVREHPRLGPYVQGLTHHAVPTLASLISRVEEGTRARKTASTLQNPTSSRSHALLTLTLLPSSSNLGQSVAASAGAPNGAPRKNDFPRGSKLHLVDLAGSESAAACGGINRLKEGANINKSLVALGNVISALAERGSTGTGPGRRFIPYRDSALTWLLKDALGGNATTVMLATISPASGSYNETSHTLRFAQRAQSVVNRPVINEDPVSRIIRELRAEVARLKCLLLEKNVNPDPDTKSICLCQRNQKPKVFEEPETVTIDKGKGLSEASESPINVENSRISERRHSTSGSPFSRNELTVRTVRRFASFETVDESTSPNVFDSAYYNQAKVSELLIDDEVDEPVFVDIPTLVAVLIKPDNNIQINSHQIEEISDGTPEEVIDADFQESNDPNSLFQNSNESPTKNNSSLESPETITSSSKKSKLRKQDSIDGDLSSKRSSNLQSLKKYGSIESLTKKKETSSLQRSTTNLEKRNGNLEKIKKLNNIKEVEDQKLNKFSSQNWRNLGAWASKDLQRKGSNDSDKSLKDSSNLKPKNQQRKQSIDCLKRKTSKDSSSSSSKDELLPAALPDKASRKGSLDQDQIPARIHTPIQRGRRAEIVAAVTERLYSSKKLADENNQSGTAGTTASTPASELRSPESSDVKLASATRMRLQEISRKMLAKRRRICVDTQTDNQQTVRMRDAASLTEEIKIISKDASILTDRHEDFEILPFIDSPIIRVKEMATITDSDLRKPVVRCKNAGNITDDYYEDTINSPRNDSGIMSDDTQNYAESNLSGISDLFNIAGRTINECVENSTNTRMPSGLPNSSSQTRREDLIENNCNCYKSRCCHGNNEFSHNHNENYQIEKNVISISLPDMVNITIESSNGLESKIKVFEGSESTQSEKTSVNFKDTEVQTDAKKAQEIGTSIDETIGQVCFNDFSTSTKPIVNQGDNKTFRIENIFHQPSVSKTPPTIEIVPSTLKNSLIVTNSIGTSIIPETRENATCMERSRNYNSRMFLGAMPRRRYAINEGFAKNTWPMWRSCSPNSRKGIYTGFSPISENHRSSSSISNFHCRNKDSQNIKEFFNKISSAEIERPKHEKIVKLSESSKITECANLMEQEANFSDDSLDPMEDSIKKIISIEKSIGNDKVCPPDVVAHTKKEEKLISNKNSENQDFEDDMQIEFPKSKVDSSSDFSAPLTDFKLLILGDPFRSTNLTDDFDAGEFGSESSTSTLKIDEEDCYSSGDAADDTKKFSIENEDPRAPKSIMKKFTRRTRNPQITDKCKNKCKKKVRFAIPEVFEISSDSELTENHSSDEETSDENSRTILEEYLDEAVVFMRNMNSMNELMNAAGKFEKCKINGRNRRGKAKRTNYIEYEGRRISLDDETDEYIKSDDEDLKFDVESYEKCLRSMDRLEECMARVKRHDEILRDNYGIENVGSTGARLDLAKFSIDSKDSSECRKDKIDDEEITKNSTNIDIKNNNLTLKDESDKDNFSDINKSENLKKSRSRRFSKFSEMRKNNGMTYSQLRGKYGSQVFDTSVIKKENHLDFDGNVGCSKIDESTNKSDAEILQTPECYLVLPKTKRNIGVPLEGIKSSNSRFSLSKYDSSNESSSSNEALATFMESIDNVARSKDKFKYPGSPRAKFLQLLSERRRIVENTRSTVAS